MDTLFEISGVDFNAEEALRHSPLSELAETWQRGDAYGLTGKQTHSDSGLFIFVGGGDDADLEQQIADVLGFLGEQSAEIRRLRGLPGVTKASLRFGELWNPEKTAGRFSRFPSGLLLTCGQLGLEIVLCQYLTSDILDSEPKTT